MTDEIMKHLFFYRFYGSIAENLEPCKMFKVHSFKWSHKKIILNLIYTL